MLWNGGISKLDGVEISSQSFHLRGSPLPYPSNGDAVELRVMINMPGASKVYLKPLSPVLMISLPIYFVITCSMIVCSTTGKS